MYSSESPNDDFLPGSVVPSDVFFFNRFASLTVSVEDTLWEDVNGRVCVSLPASHTPTGTAALNKRFD